MMSLLDTSRRLLALVAVTVATLTVACAGIDDEAEPIASTKQAQQSNQCECVVNGQSQSVWCYDTCFDDVAQCGDPNGPCMGVCLFDDATFSNAGADCETGDPSDPARGICADLGVGPQGRSGCCLGCTLRDANDLVVCGGPGDPMACGNPGDECRPCVDDDPNDCQVPTCQQGNCDLMPGDVGSDCVAGNGAAGRCSANQVCCTGCLTPGGNCNPMGLTDSGACGKAGEVCKICDDANACNGNEYCDQGTCRPGQVIPNCNDGNPCTSDGCDPAQGCVYSPNTGDACSDGNPCTANDSCNSNGECKGGADVSCDDGNPCTVDSCGISGTCQNVAKPDGDPCVDDTSTCGSDGMCDSGRCIVADNCHDETNPCLTSDCDDNGSCSEVDKPDGTPCDDGNPCTTGDSCDSGECVGGDAPDCDDNNACTDDSCDPSDGCVHEDSDTDCTDGDPCTENDKCVDGVCAGVERDCEPTNSCQESGLCDPDNGACAFVDKEDGSPCGDGSECKDGVCGGAKEPGSGGSGGTGGGTASGGGNTRGGSGGSDGQGAAGEAGSNGASDGIGGTFSGEDYLREPKGCDCREAPGSVPGGATWLGWLGLAAFATRRRRRARLS